MFATNHEVKPKCITVIHFSAKDMEVGLFESWKNIGNQKLHESNLIFITYKERFPRSADACRKINKKLG